MPYIGDYDDPNLDEFIRDNEHLRTGYRIFFHTYDLCARSLFMVHNETINVWSHLIGSLIFVAMGFYVLICLAPTSLHGEQVSLAARWTQDFDIGRFDDLHCDREDWKFPSSQ